MKNNPGNTKRGKIFRGIIYTLATLFLVSITIVIIAGVNPPATPTTPSGFKQIQSVYVLMEDGTKIAVRISLPPNLSEGERIPAIIETTRYLTEQKNTFLLNIILNLGIGRKAPDEIKNALLEEGYAFLKIDARGSGASFGKREMELSKEEIEDIGQVIDWVIEQPWSNGKVGTYGISYSGNTAELAVALNHPNLIATAPLYADFEPMAQLIMPGGIFNTFLTENWSESVSISDANMEIGIFDGGIIPVDDDKNGQLLDQALQERNNIKMSQAFENVTYFDDSLTEQYTAYSLAPFHYKDEIQKSGVPFYVRVGWMDAGTVNGAIERFLTYTNSQLLVIGPWNHGGRQFYDPFLETNRSRVSLEKEQAQEILAFFDCYMKDEENSLPRKEIRYYTMGEGVWKTTNVWPVAGFTTTPFYFHSDSSMSTIKPEDTIGANRYNVDFSATTGEDNRWRTNLGGGPIVYPDRIEEDKKLLTYTSEPLESNVEITGNPIVTLNLSSDTTDGALFVYLEDVSPEGKVTYITEGQLRALHINITSDDTGRVVLGPKHSFMRKDGEEMVPGNNVELKIGMFATSVLIEKGHRLRIAIAGHDASNFERIPKDANPTIELQTNGNLLSFVELPMKVR
jgi:uncharacterized protein